MDPDFSKSAAMRMEAMAEPDYMPAGVTVDHEVKVAGQSLEVPVVNLDGFGEQGLADEETV